MWFKVRTDFITNKKINIIKSMPDGYGMIFVWFSFLAIAAECNRQGRLYFSDDMPYTSELFASALNIPINLINFSIETFKKLNMLEEITDENGLVVYRVKKYEEYQNTDGIEKAKELNRQRVIKFREKQKLLSYWDDELEEKIYQCYLDGYTLRDIGKKFNVSKDTASRVIKKIKSAGGKKIKDYNQEEDSLCPSQDLSRACPTSVSNLSQTCLKPVSNLSQDETEIVSNSVSSYVSRDSVNTDESNDSTCNITSNVSVTLRNAYKNKNKDIDKDLESKKENTEEEDMRNGENRRYAEQENRVIFNEDTNALEITEPLLKVLESAYPKIDLNLKFKEMSLWLMANPETVSEIQLNGSGNFMRFVVKWLANEKKKIKKTVKFQISFDPETASFTGLTEDYLNILKSKFPILDTLMEIKKMESWLLNNPSRRPAKDYMRFINHWLTRAQDDKALKSSNNYFKKTWDEIRTEKNNEISKRLEEKIKAGLL